MTNGQATRYLALLGMEAGSPSRAALSRLVAAHLARVPFENVGKLLAHGRGEAPGVPSLDAFLDGVERAGLGGTCYACAGHLHALLRHLGYDVALCGAAMARPDVHAVNLVQLEGRPWLVDVGYGAPLARPLPLDLAEPATAAALGRDRWVVRPRDADGRSRVDHLRDDAVIHGYVVDPAGRDLGHFAPAVADSFRPDAEFLRQLRIVHHRPERSVLVRDRRVTVVAGEVVRARELADWEELGGMVETLVGIPRRVVRDAVSRIEPGPTPP